MSAENTRDNRADKVISFRVPSEVKEYVQGAIRKAGYMNEAEFMRGLIANHKQSAERTNAGA